MRLVECGYCLLEVIPCGPNRSLSAIDGIMRVHDRFGRLGSFSNGISERLARWSTPAFS
jgi:hypothetical protein